MVDIMNNESSDQQSPDWLTEFNSVYQRLSIDNLALLDSIYHPQVTFIDPIHEINGLDDLQEYFQGLYQNLSRCQFIIGDVIAQPHQAAIYWEMIYQHPKLNKGNEVSVLGSSHLKAKDGKIIYHRDFLDLGSMLYEQLPVLGKVIRLVKNRAAQ